MVCRYCKKPISITRRLVDSEFCSKKHRTAFSARSARALREMGDFTYSVADVLRDTDEFAIPKKKKPQGGGGRSAATVFGVAALTIAAMVIFDRTGGAPVELQHLGATRATDNTHESPIKLKSRNLSTAPNTMRCADRMVA